MVPGWMVALEAVADGGAGIDVPVLARRLRAIGDARPTDPGGRYTLILRPTDGDPAEALRTAVSDWQEATASLGQDGARLLAARVVLHDTDRRTPNKRRSLRLPSVSLLSTTPARRRGAIAIAVIVLVLGAFIGFRALSTPSRPQLGPGAQLAERAASSANLLPDGSFERATDTAPVQRWGAASAELVGEPVAHGSHAERILVTPGHSGGVWIDTAVQAGATYDQSVLLRVDALENGARVEVGLEWYDASHTLLGYRMLPVDMVDHRFTERQQRMAAPAGASSVRFLVNATGGANYVVDDAAVVVVPPT